MMYLIDDKYRLTNSGGSETFSFGGGQWGHGFGGAFNRNNYRSPTTNYTIVVYVK